MGPQHNKVLKWLIPFNEYSILNYVQLYRDSEKSCIWKMGIYSVNTIDFKTIKKKYDMTTNKQVRNYTT